MSLVRYVTLDPTGNITCLVTQTSGVDEKRITQRLMKECEQVAYLEGPTQPGSLARIRLMGGEFCGNAAMASACWLAMKSGRLSKESTVFPIEMSGMSGILPCRVRSLPGCCEGTVPMPPVREILPFQAEGFSMVAVRLEGIVHLILSGPPFPSDRQAEDLLRRIAPQWEEEAVGLLMWNEETLFMRPLVLVKGSETLVWETGCGSGSASVGAWRAAKGSGRTVTPVHQPGGIIEASADFHDGVPENITITGRVRFGAEKSLAAEDL